jgi:hypothetical protein
MAFIVVTGTSLKPLVRFVPSGERSPDTTVHSVQTV